MKNKKLVSVVLAASMMASTGMTAFATVGELQKEQKASVVCEAGKANAKIRFKPNEFNWNRIKEGKKYDFDFKVFDSELSTTEKEQFFESINVAKEGDFYVITINCKSAKIKNTPLEIDATGIELFYFDDLKAKEPITIDADFDHSKKVGKIKLPKEAIGYRPYRAANDFDNLVRVKINTNAKDKLFGPKADEYAEYDSHLAFSVLNDAPVVNKTELEEAIKDAKAIISNRDDYAPAGVTFMEKKLTEAESVFSNDDATEDEVNTATANLRKAIDRVYKKADLTDLIAEQNRAKVTIEDYSHLYTEASIDLYKATYDRARLLVYEFTSGKRPNLKQKEVDSTLNNLKNSREQLKKKSDDKLDINNLEDGKYELGSYLWHELRDQESMGNSALKHTAYLTVKDGKYTLTIGGRGMTVGTMTGYLDAYRIVTNGLNPREDNDAEYTEVEVKQDGLDCTADIVLTNTDNVTEYYYGSIKVYAKLPDGSIVYPMGKNWVNSRLRLSWDGIQVIELDRIKEVEAARPGAIEEIQNYRSNEEFGEEEAEKLEAIKKNTINLINKVEYMESLNTALENGKAAMDMVKSEAYKKEEADRQAELEQAIKDKEAAEQKAEEAAKKAEEAEKKAKAAEEAKEQAEKEAETAKTAAEKAESALKNAVAAKEAAEALAEEATALKESAEKERDLANKEKVEAEKERDKILADLTATEEAKEQAEKEAAEKIEAAEKRAEEAEKKAEEAEKRAEEAEKRAEEAEKRAEEAEKRAEEAEKKAEEAKKEEDNKKEEDIKNDDSSKEKEDIKEKKEESTNTEKAESTKNEGNKKTPVTGDPNAIMGLAGLGAAAAAGTGILERKRKRNK